MDLKPLATFSLLLLTACGAGAPSSPLPDRALDAAPAPSAPGLGVRPFLAAHVPSRGLPWMPVWARGLRQSSGRDPEALTPTSLAVGPHGRAAVGAAFTGLVDLDAVPLVTAGARGAALVRYSEDGAVLWGRSFAATGDEVVRAVAVDYAERVLASGALGDEAMGEGGPAFPPGRPGEAIVLGAFSDGGEGLWAARATGLLLAGPLAVQRSNHVVFGASYFGDVTLDRREQRSRGARDGLLARFDPTGALLWTRSIGGADDDEVLAVAAGADGEIGACVRTVSPDGITLHLLRLDSDGELRWSRDLPVPPGALDVAGLAFDSGGALLLAGTLRGAADLGGGELRPSGDSDLALAGYGPGGDLLFARLVGGPGADVATAVAVDGRDLVLLAGTFSGSLKGGSDTITSQGASDWLVATLSRRGDPLGVGRLGGPGADRGGLLAVDGTEHVVLTGSIEAPSPFGDSALPGPAGVIAQLFR